MKRLHRQVAQNPEGHDHDTDRTDDTWREREPRRLLAPPSLYCAQDDPNNSDERSHDHQQIVIGCLKKIPVQRGVQRTGDTATGTVITGECPEGTLRIER